MNSYTKQSFLLSIILIIGFSISAQVPQGWHLLDKEKTGYYGINIDKAYEFLKTSGRKSNTVIVGVIDSGIDTTHEDLKPVLWINKKEIPGNGIDDDGNGYIDDIYGWNFLGSKDGLLNVTKDTYEKERVYEKFRERWNKKEVDADTLSKEDRFEYEMWLRAKAEVKGSEELPNFYQIMQLQMVYRMLTDADNTFKTAMGKEVYTGRELADFKFDSLKASRMQDAFISLLSEIGDMEMTNEELLTGLKEELDFISSLSEMENVEDTETPPIVPYRADAVKDNYNDLTDKSYGNNNVQVDNESAFHGTHVAGIIGAARNNKTGIDGVADNVRIMSLRAVPDGDEHDKDIALAIRYAVDNGAKVINMSFGKAYSPEKHWVDEAVAYANEKGVLLVHAAGNDASNNDSSFNFPTSISKYGDKKYDNWIEVGASGPNDAEGNTFIARFSNYGKEQVDVFAPGVRIYSTIPGGNTYGNAQGTSMASPVVAGIAALIFQYYPELTPQEVKEAIENSVQKTEILVNKPGGSDKVSVSEISKTGGFVDAYGAVQYAAKIAAAKPQKQNNKKTQPAKKAA